MQILETRLDNVLRRLGVGADDLGGSPDRSPWACLGRRRKTDIASYLVKPGQTITFKEGHA